MFRIQSQIINRKHICKQKKLLEEYCVKIYEINPCFYEHYQKCYVSQNWK